MSKVEKWLRFSRLPLLTADVTESESFDDTIALYKHYKPSGNDTIVITMSTTYDAGRMSSVYIHSMYNNIYSHSSVISFTFN